MPGFNSLAHTPHFRLNLLQRKMCFSKSEKKVLGGVAALAPVCLPAHALAVCSSVPDVLRLLLTMTKH